MAGKQQRIVGYGLSDSLPNIFPSPIVGNRAPQTTDMAQIGQIWVEPKNSAGVAQNLCWILTSIINNSANWLALVGGGGAGVFANLTVTPGPTALTGQFTVTSGAGNAVSIGADATDHNITIGNVSGTSSLVLDAGTGGLVVTTAAAGIITLGAATMTGTITIGQGTAVGGQVINIASGANAGVQQVNISNGASGANSVVNILSGAGTAGTQTFNVLGAGATRAGDVNIGTGAAAHIVAIGSTTGAASTTINGGTLGITLDAPFTALPGPVYLYTGAGAPAGGLALHVGDVYINTAAATAATRMYIATGVGAWTNVTCAA